MAVYRSVGDRVEAERLYVVFERAKGKPHLVSTTGRHNCQGLTVEGNPAVAHVARPLRFLSGGILPVDIPADVDKD
jgi:hypothetical protein